jgi:hypothetical protein
MLRPLSYIPPGAGDVAHLVRVDGDRMDVLIHQEVQRGFQEGRVF